MYLVNSSFDPRLSCSSLSVIAGVGRPAVEAVEENQSGVRPRPLLSPSVLVCVCVCVCTCMYIS